MKKKHLLFMLPLVGMLGATVLLGCNNNANDFDAKTHEIYQLYRDNGGTMTYDQWLASIKGEKGEKGDKGDAGETGMPGSKGDKGDKGDTGNDILVGNGEPAPDLGRDGDHYIDSATGNIYAKNNNVWVATGDSVKGDAGSSVLTGRGQPTGGKDGDAYIDIDTGEIWKKYKGVWEDEKVTIKGNKGDAGKSVYIGETLPDVKDYNIGDVFIDIKTFCLYEVIKKEDGSKAWGAASNTFQGNKIHVGTKPPTSDVGGIVGDLYIDLTDRFSLYRKVFNGTEDVWSPQGSLQAQIWFGVDDPNVSDPANSRVGDIYINTSNDEEIGGYIFRKKSNTGDNKWQKGGGSIRGPKGEKGETGAQGDKGDKGDTGSGLLVGPKDPAGDEGKNGDIYINLLNGEIWKKVDGTWVDQKATVKGNQGDKGDKGDKGDAGDKGDKGDKGDTGDAGPTGAKGDKGDTGEQGEKGEKGADGKDGKTIDVGLTSQRPSADSRNEGDVYIDAEAYLLYHVKVNEAGKKEWVEDGRTFKGEKGSEILMGAADSSGPSKEEGRIGDLFIDKNTFNFYLKKGTQTEPIKGEWEYQGTARASILSGDKDPTKDTIEGAKYGDIYINTTTDAEVGGYIFTYTYNLSTQKGEWVKGGSIRGPQGVKGDKGDKGEQGISIYAGDDLPENVDDYNVDDLFINTKQFKIYRLIKTASDKKDWTQVSNKTFEGTHFYVNETLPSTGVGNIGDLCLVLQEGGEIYKKITNSTGVVWSPQGRLRSKVFSGNDDPRTKSPTSSPVTGDMYINTSGDATIGGHVFIYDANKKQWEMSEGSLRGPRGATILSGENEPTKETVPGMVGDYYIHNNLKDHTDYLWLMTDEGWTRTNINLAGQTGKSAFKIYCESHPDYKPVGDTETAQEQYWINQLARGELSESVKVTFDASDSQGHIHTGDIYEITVRYGDPLKNSDIAVVKEGYAGGCTPAQTKWDLLDADGEVIRTISNDKLDDFFFSYQVIHTITFVAHS